MGDQTDEMVKLRLRFKPSDDLPMGEGMWAKSVDAHDGGGTYRLLNSSFMVPLAVDDVVRAEVDGWGALQVVDVVEPGPRVLTVVEYPQAMPNDEVRDIADSWTAGTDGWTEGANHLLYTVWADGVTPAMIAGIFAQTIGEETGWAWHATSLPADRTREQQDEIDFTLDTEGPEPIETDYWAPEDPAWVELGITGADQLALIQQLASEDPRVAATLKNGKHRNVLTYLERLTTDDPASLPPLDGPLLDEP